MIKKLTGLAVVACFVVLAVGYARVNAEHHGGEKEVLRFGMVIGLKPDVIDEYKRLHADDNEGVRDLLSKYNMQNFNIFLHEIDGKWYEFGYYEYVGDDYDGDMAKLDAEPRNKAWLEVCDPMQLPLPGQKGWAMMDRVYFNK
jgi:L-rhamnose mutarotase